VRAVLSCPEQSVTPQHTPLGGYCTLRHCLGALFANNNTSDKANDGLFAASLAAHWWPCVPVWAVQAALQPQHQQQSLTTEEEQRSARLFVRYTWELVSRRQRKGTTVMVVAHVAQAVRRALECGGCDDQCLQEVLVLCQYLLVQARCTKRRPHPHVLALDATTCVREVSEQVCAVLLSPKRQGLWRQGLFISTVRLLWAALAVAARQKREGNDRGTHTEAKTLIVAVATMLHECLVLRSAASDTTDSFVSADDIGTNLVAALGRKLALEIIGGVTELRGHLSLTFYRKMNENTSHMIVLGKRGEDT
jgi:hypothetical protein